MECFLGEMMSSAIMIIPARAGSKGVKGKNIRLLAGVPLVAHSIKAAKACDKITQVYVSTDGADIADIAREYGAHVIERPNDISSDIASSESAILHALDAIESTGAECPKYVYFTQCTSPLTRTEDFVRAMDMMETGQFDSIFAAKKFHGFIWRKNENGQMGGVNHDHNSRRLMRQEMMPEYQETGAFYLMNTEMFRRHKKRFFGRIGVCEIPEERSIDIDTLDDFNKAESFMKSEQKT